MSDRIVHPTFGQSSGRNASNTETALMVAAAFITAGLMIWGAIDFGRLVFSLLR